MTWRVSAYPIQSLPPLIADHKESIAFGMEPK